MKVYKHIHTGECVTEQEAWDYAIAELRKDKSEKNDFLTWYYEAKFRTFEVPEEHVDDFIAYGENWQEKLNEQRVELIEDYDDLERCAI